MLVGMMVRTARSVLKRWSLPVEPRSPAVNRGARHIETANGGRNAGIKRILNNCLTKASDLWYSIHRVTASFVWFFLVIKLYHKLLGLLLFFYHLCLISIVIIHFLILLTVHPYWQNRWKHGIIIYTAGRTMLFWRTGFGKNLPAKGVYSLSDSRKRIW